MPCETKFRPYSSVKRKYETPKVSISPAPKAEEAKSETESTRAETVETPTSSEWDDWTVNEMKKEASSRELSGYSRMKRNELAALLDANPE